MDENTHEGTAEGTTEGTAEGIIEYSDVVPNLTARELGDLGIKHEVLPRRGDETLDRSRAHWDASSARKLYDYIMDNFSTDDEWEHVDALEEIKGWKELQDYLR